MSNDFEVAIEEGANMVRIGTGILGQEQQNNCRKGEKMSGKTFLKNTVFLGIEDEVSQEHEKDNFEPYVARPESKPIGRVINIHQTSKNKMVIFKPDSFEEVREISDEVKNRRAAIVNLEKLDRENAKQCWILWQAVFMR